MTKFVTITINIFHNENVVFPYHFIIPFVERVRIYPKNPVKNKSTSLKTPTKSFKIVKFYMLATYFPLNRYFPKI